LHEKRRGRRNAEEATMRFLRSICAMLLVVFASMSLLSLTPSRADAIGYYRWQRVPYYYGSGYNYNPYGAYNWGGYYGSYPYYSSYRAYPWGWYW